MQAKRSFDKLAGITLPKTLQNSIYTKAPESELLQLTRMRITFWTRCFRKSSEGVKQANVPTLVFSTIKIAHLHEFSTVRSNIMFACLEQDKDHFPVYLFRPHGCTPNASSKLACIASPSSLDVSGSMYYMSWWYWVRPAGGTVVQISYVSGYWKILDTWSGITHSRIIGHVTHKLI